MTIPNIRAQLEKRKKPSSIKLVTGIVASSIALPEKIELLKLKKQVNLAKTSQVLGIKLKENDKIVLRRNGSGLIAKSIEISDINTIEKWKNKQKVKKPYFNIIETDAGRIIEVYKNEEEYKKRLKF